MDSKIIFWGGSAYALRGYGVTLGSSSSYDPFFSRPPAPRPTGRRASHPYPCFTRSADAAQRGNATPKSNLYFLSFFLNYRKMVWTILR
jgi:hypothetical protein